MGYPMFGEEYLATALAAPLTGGVYMSLHTETNDSGDQFSYYSYGDGDWLLAEPGAADYARVALTVADFEFTYGGIILSESAAPVEFTSAAVADWGTIRSVGLWTHATSTDASDLVLSIDLPEHGAMTVLAGDPARITALDFRINRASVWGVQPPQGAPAPDPYDYGH